METQRNKWKSKVVAMFFSIIAILPLGWQMAEKHLKPNLVVVVAVVYFILLAALDCYRWSDYVPADKRKKRDDYSAEGIRQYHLYSALRNLAIAYTLWSIGLIDLRQGRPIDRVLGIIGFLSLLFVVGFSSWLCQQALKEEETK